MSNSLKNVPHLNVKPGDRESHSDKCPLFRSQIALFIVLTMFAAAVGYSLLGTVLPLVRLDVIKDRSTAEFTTLSDAALRSTVLKLGV